jgi:hypothetical protein
MRAALTMISVFYLTVAYGQNSFNVKIDLSSNKEDSITFVFYKMVFQENDLHGVEKEFERVVENKDQIQTLSFPQNESWSVSIINWSKQVIKYVHINNSGPGRMTFPNKFIPDFSITDQLQIGYNLELKKYEYVIFRY